MRIVLRLFTIFEVWETTFNQALKITVFIILLKILGESFYRSKERHNKYKAILIWINLKSI